MDTRIAISNKYNIKSIAELHRVEDVNRRRQ